MKDDINHTHVWLFFGLNHVFITSGWGAGQDGMLKAWSAAGG